MTQTSSFTVKTLGETCGINQPALKEKKNQINIKEIEQCTRYQSWFFIPSRHWIWARYFLLLICYSFAFKGQHMAAEAISASTTKHNLCTKKGNGCLLSRSLLFMMLSSENKNVIENNNKPVHFCDYPRNTPISVLNQPVRTRFYVNRYCEFSLP